MTASAILTAEQHHDLRLELQAQHIGGDSEAQARDVVKAALAILRKHVSEPVHLTLLNLGATNFAPLNKPAVGGSKGKGNLAPSITRLLRSHDSRPAAVPLPAGVQSMNIVIDEVACVPCSHCWTEIIPSSMLLRQLCKHPCS